jgi:hypothetical protein
MPKSGNKARILVERMQLVPVCPIAFYPERLLPVTSAKKAVRVALPLVETHYDMRWPLWARFCEESHRSLGVFPRCFVEIFGLSIMALFRVH